MRLSGKTAIVVGAGQSPGERIGNGRATAILFAREGAQVLVVDRDGDSAQETVAAIEAEGWVAKAHQADVTEEADLRRMIERGMEEFGKLDVLHNNVGVSIAGGDAKPQDIAAEDFDRLIAVNLRGTVLACKHALPIMRKAQAGVITNISSIAAITAYPLVGYKATKAALIAYTEQLAIQNAKYGIRANAILPGAMDTPMAVDTRVRATGRSREEVAADRDRAVPLRGRMGTAWDVAHAALFLSSDEANFITGAALPVDGGMAVRRG